MNVVQREISCKTGTEGCRHDPYSFTERLVVLNGIEIKAHSGLLNYLKIDGTTEVDNEIGVEPAFERWTGMCFKVFDEAYNRVHPYFDDPYGRISDYI